MAMEAALDRLHATLATTEAIDEVMRGGTTATSVKEPLPRRKPQHAEPRCFGELVHEAVEACRASRKRQRAEAGPPTDLSDAALSQFGRFTREMALAPFQSFLHFVPRLVNVVTLAEALPVPGSGLTLPLNLHHVASRCTGAFHSPRRFAAVQLAFSNPRCRVLVFHTGRLVGTGTNSPLAARMAICRAQRLMAEEANVHLTIRNFAVINTVGASSLRATLNCDAFANAHSGESHYDRNSFVGLAWRPSGEPLCCEIYSTGRSNLPGSIAERQLLGAYSRMLPELLRFSSSSALLEKFPEELQAAHRVDEGHVSAASKKAKATEAPKDLWAGWGVGDASLTGTMDGYEAGEEEDEAAELALASLGM